MQMVERPWGISAYGAASVKAMPDLVRVRFRVIRVEQTPAASFAAATEAVRAVRQALRQHDIADAAVSRSRLDLRSAWDGYGDGRRFLGYQCQAAFSMESANLDIQVLLVNVVEAGANEIDGVDFDVTAKAELRAQARQEAVQAARRKAELYAGAAGVRLGALLHLEDVDPDQTGYERYRGHGSGGNASEEDFAPGHVVVSAAAIVGYAIARD